MALDGEKLRNIRLAKGISQEKLALMCNVNKRTIQRAEKGEPIALETAAFIAEAVQIPAASLRSTRLVFLEPQTKAWNDVVLVPASSGRRIIDTLRSSFEAEISFEVEPTKQIIEPLTRIAKLMSLFKPDPWEQPRERYDPNYAEILEKQAELNEVLPELAGLGVNLFLGTYKARKQEPRYDMEEGVMYVRPNWAAVEVTIALLVITDTSATHLIRRPDDVFPEDDEIPF